jgi:hypothetical protein
MPVTTPRPTEIDPRPCQWCGRTIDYHRMVDGGEGPEFFCADVSLDDLTLEELERRAELIRQIETAEIFARLEAMDDPSKRPPPREPAPKPYRTPQSTIDAWRYLIKSGDAGRARAWLADRPKDAPYLLQLLEG